MKKKISIGVFSMIPFIVIGLIFLGIHLKDGHGIHSSKVIKPTIQIETINIDGIIKSDTTYIYKEK